MKFSYVMLPDYPLEESLRAIKLADELGFYGCYAADETWHKDLWLLFAAAADKTKTFRLAPLPFDVKTTSTTSFRKGTVDDIVAGAGVKVDAVVGGRAEADLDRFTGGDADPVEKALPGP